MFLYLVLSQHRILYISTLNFQMALYTRNQLNIRTTANFLLAYAANNKNCRPYLKKYFTASIRLPSDWIDVAEQYQVCYYSGCLMLVDQVVWLKVFSTYVELLWLRDHCDIHRFSMEKRLLLFSLYDKAIIDTFVELLWQKIIVFVEFL